MARLWATLVVFATCMLGLGVGEASASVDVLEPEADAWISEDSPNTNYGSDDPLRMQFQPGTAKLALIRFDLSAYPAGQLLHRATLNLNLDPASSTPDSFTIRFVEFPWDEPTVRWSSFPTLTILDGRDIRFVGDVDGTTSVDVLPLVSAWVDGTIENFGFLISAPQNGDEVRANSRETSVTSLRPTLEIWSEPTRVWADDFLQVSYSQNNGNRNWDGPWFEWTDGFTGSSSGEILITDTTPGPRRVLAVSGNPGIIQRHGNTLEPGYARAELSFLARRFQFGGTSALVEVQVSTSDGSSWETVGSMVGPGTDDDFIRYTYDISDHLSDRFAIRFRTEWLTDNEWFFVDDLRVSLFSETDIALTKTVDDPTPQVGQRITYRITATSTRSTGATDVLITDLLPEGVFFAGADPGPGTYDDSTGEWYVPSIAAGDSAVLLLEADVSSDEEGSTITNEAALKGLVETDVNASNNVATADIDVGGIMPLGIDVAVTQSVVPMSASPGDTVVIAVDAENLSPVDASTVYITHVLDAELIVIDRVRSKGNWNEPQGEWNLKGLASGEKASMVVTAIVDAATVATSLNSYAQFDYLEQPDSNPSNNQSSLDIPILSADIELTSSSSVPEANVGDLVGFNIVARNLGPNDVADVQIAVVVPASLANPVVGTTGGSYDDITKIWTIPSLSVGPSVELQMGGSVATGAGGGSLDASATRIASTPGDNDDTNDMTQASIAVLAADIQMTKVVDVSNPAEGATVVYTVTVENLGPDPATGLVVQDLLPTGVTYVTHSASTGSYVSGTGNWDIGDLSLGSPVTLTLDATVDAGTSGSTIRNTASVFALDQEDPDQLNDTANADIGATSTDLSMALGVDDLTPDVGDTLTFTATVTNNGPVAASGIVVETQTPVGLRFVDATPERGSYDDLTEIWDLGGLSVSGTTTLTLRVSVEAGTGGISLAEGARITALDQTESDDTNDLAEVTVTVRAADLELAMVASGGPASEGDTVEFLLTLTNQGPDPLFGVTVLDSLGAGLTYGSDIPTQGSYDTGTGIWAVGDLAVSAAETLSVFAVVQPGTAGSTLNAHARRDTIRTFDPDPSDDSAQASVRVPLVDLQVFLDASPLRINPGDTTTVLVELRNDGPDGASNVQIQLALPAFTSLREQTTSVGSYNNGSRVWTIPNLAPLDLATMDLRLIALPNTAGQSGDASAHVLAVNEPDAEASNDSSRVTLVVPSADVAVTKTASAANVRNDDIVDWTIQVENIGPDDLTTVAIRDTLAAELTLLDASTAHGSWLEAQDLWNIGALPAGSTATLTLTTQVNGGSDSFQVMNRAWATNRDVEDPVPSNDVGVDSVSVSPRFTVLAAASQPSGVVLEPTRGRAPVFRLLLENRSAVSRTLDGFTLSDMSIGNGTPLQMDESWSSFTLNTAGTAVVLLDNVAPVFMSNGKLQFDGLNLSMGPGRTLELIVRGGASATARDGDLLDLQLSQPEDIVFREPVDLDGLWPLAPSAQFAVDGMQSAQVTVFPTPKSLLFTGTDRNLVLDFVVPANGYEDDILRRVNLKNMGTALQGIHLSSMELWADDGDSLFNPDLDLLLGPLAPTGDLWEITGIKVDVPAPGLRLFASANIADAVAAGQPVLEGRTLQFALPIGEELALLLDSDNDGPLDAIVANEKVASISTVDKITLTPAPIAAGAVLPGQANVPMLAMEVANTYETLETLQSIELTHTTVGTGTRVELDLQIEGLTLVLDDDSDGAFNEGAGDIWLGDAFFVDGVASFTDLGLDVPGGEDRRVLVLATVSDTRAADGDVLSLNLDDPRDIDFSRAVALAGEFPIDSGASWTIDGMRASQVDVATSPTLSLGPDEGPVLAMDLRVPPNGYRDDSLVAIVVENAGTATLSDVQEIRAWRDGGDGSFTPGSGDDLDLGPLVPLIDSWTSPVLDQAVSAGGVRIFLGLTVGAAPTDSSTVRLRLPTDGLTMASGNDGPIDQEVLAEGSLLLSSAPLLASFEIAPQASSIGQALELRVVIRNSSDELIRNIAPVGMSVSGSGAMTVVGPNGPTTLDLAPDTVDTLRFDLTADTAGSVRISGRVGGDGDTSGVPRTSIEALSNPHQIFVEADDLALTPIPAAPFSVNRGQSGSIPLSLTFANDGGVGSSAVLLREVRLKIEDDAGVGIVPSDLFSAISVSEGSVEYLRRTSLETTGDTVTLPLTSPVEITAGEQVTLSFKVDVDSLTLEPNFRLALIDETWMMAEDATTGAPVNIQLAGTGSSFPIRSGLATVGDEAEELRLAAFDLTPREVVRGQSDASLGSIDLINPGVPGVTSDLRVSALAFRLADATGSILPDVGAQLQGLTAFDGTTLVASSLIAPGDSTVVLDLVPPLTVAGDDTLRLDLEGPLSETAALGILRWSLDNGPDIITWDANTAENLPVALEVDPLFGAPVEVLAPADSVRVSATAQAPLTTVLGETEVHMLSLCLHHPGDLQTSSLSLESVAVKLRSASQAPLSLAEHFDRIRIVRGDGSYVELVDPPAEDNVALTIPGWILQPAMTDTLDILVDIDLGAPAGALEIVVRQIGLDVRDAASQAAVQVLTLPGESFPLESGLTQLIAPARELMVELHSRMPATLISNSADVDVAEIVLGNPAAEGAGDIQLGWLTVRAGDRDLSPLALGAWVDRLELWREDVSIAVTTGLNADSTTATLTLSPPLSIAAATELSLDLRIDSGSALPVAGLALGVENIDIGVIQPASAALSVDVSVPAPLSFPLYTEAASSAARNLEDSFSNYPNPFAAGRESTRIPFFLPSDGQVTVEVYTLDGDRVIQLLDAAPLSAGLHEDLEWDGRNGDGSVVRNGVYLMRLKFDGAGAEEILRKVAVVR